MENVKDWAIVWITMATLVIYAIFSIVRVVAGPFLIFYIMSNDVPTLLLILMPIIILDSIYFSIALIAHLTTRQKNI